MNRFRSFRRFHHNDERGATLILVSVAMSLLLPVGLAFAVEIGEDTVVNRSLQTAADAGALDGARYLGVLPDTVPAIAAQAVQRNYPGVSSSVQEGSWTSAGGFVASVTCASAGTCTAVQVTTNSSVKHLFEAGSNSLSKSAIATRYGGSCPLCISGGPTYYGESGFSIGTYLASISPTQQSVLNQLLSHLGTSAGVTVVGYAGMANTFVTVQNLIDASGGVLTPSNVLTTSLTGAQWDSFLGTAVASQTALLSCGGSPVPFPCSAATALGASFLGSSINGSTSASLCQMVSINGSTCASGHLSESALSASLNVLQTLTTEAQLANGTNALDVKSALNLSLAGLNVSTAKLVLTLGQIPQTRYGPVGTSASTSQINVDLQIQLLPALLGGALLDIPITGASGTATLAAVNCTNNIMTSTTIDASTNAVSNSVTLAGINAGTISIAGAPWQALNPYTVVPPNTTTENNGTNPQTVGTTSPAVSLSLVGLPAILLGTIVNNITSTLGPVLQALGVNVAGAQVADLSTDCAAATVVG